MGIFFKSETKTINFSKNTPLAKRIPEKKLFSGAGKT
jgi:hypothetical protein